MKSTETLIKEWFDIWDGGNFENLPLTDDFKHHSPYGTIEGKAVYMGVVQSNKDKFLGNRIEQEDVLCEGNRGCVRYTIHNPEFSMVVSEWLYTENGLIKEIFAYYNIAGEISEERKLKDLD